MTDDDEIEALAKAMWDNYNDRHNFSRGWDSADQNEWFAIARSALAHTERRGISFERMSNDDLRLLWDTLRGDAVNDWLNETLAIDAELARRAEKQAERDEWREAIAGVVHQLEVDFKYNPEKRIDAILAAIAPLRERLPSDRDAIEAWKQASVFWQHRAEAAEAKLAKVMEVAK